MNWYLRQRHGQLHCLRKLSPLVSRTSNHILSKRKHRPPPPSRRTYNTGVSRYTELCRQRKWSPFPVSESSLVEFVASAALEVHYQTLKIYLAGIKHHHQLAGMPDSEFTALSVSNCDKDQTLLCSDLTN